MYLETMEKVLADIDKVIIDKSSGSGVVPYFLFLKLKKKQVKNEKNFNTIFSSFSCSYLPKSVLLFKKLIKLLFYNLVTQKK